MSTLIKVGAGLCAGAAAGALAFAFWPQIQPAALNAKALVEKPVFVQLRAPATTPASEINKDALAKLAKAMPAAKSPTNSAVRGLTIPINAPAGATALAAPPSDGAPAASEAARRLLGDGLVALAEGDIAASRSFFEKAADGGEARALIVLGDTYDPATLSRMGVLGVKGDERRAQDYYARALSAGVEAARDRIASLSTE
jgi:TPR repeat protein